MKVKTLLKVIEGHVPSTSTELISFFIWGSFLVVIFFFLMLCYIYWDIAGFQFSVTEDPREALGQLGDYFGGLLNPLVSFLAFFGLIMTIVVQRDTALDDRKEAIKMNFEATFFRLIDQYDQAKAAFVIPASGITLPIRGQDAFDRVRIEIASYFRRYKSDERLQIANGVELVLTRLSISPMVWQNAIEIVLAYIDTASRHLDKDTYAGIFRSRISSSELYLILLLRTSTVSDTRFTRLATRFSLLQPLSLVGDEEFNAADFYTDDRVFGGSRPIRPSNNIDVEEI